MRLSVEILDNIFSFLVSHRETLISCSEDPVLYPIVERHLYHHIIIHTVVKRKQSVYAIDGTCPYRLASRKPHILYYVKIVEMDSTPPDPVDQWFLIHDFSRILLMFPALTCIIITININSLYPCLQEPHYFPTIKEIHVSDGNLAFALLDDCKNIENLALSGSSLPHWVLPSNSSVSQLKSLILSTNPSSRILAWVKLRINELQSLNCNSISVEMLPELLEVCSKSLTKLDFDLKGSRYCRTGTTGLSLFLDLSSVPRNLHQLTIRTAVYKHSNVNTWLPAAGKAISSFISSDPPRHLALDIDIDLSTFEDLTEIDFSPLAVLGPASLSIPRIDLYVRARGLPPALTRAQLILSLEDYEGIAKSIKEGVLVIHLEQFAPDCIRRNWTF